MNENALASKIAGDQHKNVICHRDVQFQKLYTNDAIHFESALGVLTKHFIHLPTQTSISSDVNLFDSID